jgi:hypothetical protein
VVKKVVKISYRRENALFFRKKTFLFWGKNIFLWREAGKNTIFSKKIQKNSKKILRDKFLVIITLKLF